VRDEYAIPPLRDLPGDRLAERKRHLVAEIAHTSLRRRTPMRAVVVLAATALVVALGTASAFAVHNVILGTSSGWRGSSSPVWSPDGRRIAYIVSRHRDDNDLYVMNADGSEQRRLTRKEVSHPSGGAQWSPDGRRIAFLRGVRLGGGDWKADLYVVNPNGSEQRKLGGHPAAWSAYAWSPDGRLIAFTRERGELAVMNADGSGVRVLARGGSPAWSPDGRRIAFIDGYSTVYVMNADGSGRRRLTQGGELLGLRWSPDGRKILLSCLKCAAGPRSRFSGWGEVYVMNADGSALRNLTRDPRTEGRPEWSPDGRKIAFTRIEPGERSEIVVMNADGSGKRKLAEGGGPVWSPDGRKIAFTSDRSGKLEIYAMNADGSGQRPLTP
jgi:Tol biopolymer transport system component